MRWPVDAFDMITLYKDAITRREGLSKEEYPLNGVVARVEQGSDLEKRVTATRLIATGVLALGWKKKSGGEVWLTIEGRDFFWTVEIDRKKADKARKFAARVNDTARKLPAPRIH